MLALGERLAVSMRDALLAAGFPRDKVRTVSYGAEFPALESPESPKTAGEWNRIARQLAQNSSNRSTSPQGSANTTSESVATAATYCLPFLPR